MRCPVCGKHGSDPTTQLQADARKEARQQLVIEVGPCLDKLSDLLDLGAGGSEAGDLVFHMRRILGLGRRRQEVHEETAL